MAGTSTFTEEELREDPGETTGKSKPSKPSKPPGRPLLEYLDILPDPEKSLLGRRFLCTEGACLVVGPSGIGKSSAVVQMSIYWSIGEIAFKLKPSRPLKIAIVQAEDDEGDLNEMVAGACEFFKLTPEQTKLCVKNCRIYSHKSLTGDRFLTDIIAPILEHDRPDLIIINPLQAFLGADTKNTEKVSAFLRNGINPLLERFQCACLLIHHTPKTNFRDTDKWSANDWMYAGAGAADITNWSRAVIIFEPCKTDRVYQFIAAKRGGRSGWTKRDQTYSEYFAWAADHTIFWRDATDDEIKAAKIKSDLKGPDDVLAIVPLTGRMEKSELQERAHMEIPMGEKRVRTCISTLIRESRLFVESEKRDKVRPKVWLTRIAPEVSSNGQHEE